MSSLALVLVIIAALIHATWNLFAKTAGKPLHFAFFVNFLFMVIWSPIAIYAWTAHPESGYTSWDTAAWLMVIASAVTHALYFLVLLFGYAAAPLSVVYPVTRGTGPLLVTAMALLFFDETLRAQNAIGLLLIVGGIGALSWTRNPIAATSTEIFRGVGWGLAAGGAIACYTVIDAYATKTLGLNIFLFIYLAYTLQVVLFAPFVLRDRQPLLPLLHQLIKPVMAVTILSPIAYLLILYAVQIAPLSHVAPAREISMLFGVALGGKFLSEGHIVRRCMASAAMVMGIVLLAME